MMTLLFVLQVTVWRLHRSPRGRAWYVHASHGFYLGTLANRALRALWPLSQAR